MKVVYADLQIQMAQTSSVILEDRERANWSSFGQRAEQNGVDVQ